MPSFRRVSHSRLTDHIYHQPRTRFRLESTLHLDIPNIAIEERLEFIDTHADRLKG
jgi:hypothetical protein